MLKVINACFDILNNYPIAEQAKIYLNSRLEVSGQEKFNFGYFPDYNNLNILSQFIDQDLLIKYNLLYEKSIYDGSINKTVLCGFLENHNLIMPYRDAYGDIIALVGRSLLSDEERKVSGISKYKNTSFEKNKHLFALYESKPHIMNENFAFVCEGQFDCIQAHTKGLCNVVGLGSSNMSFEQVALLLRYTKDIRLLLDNDEAGLSGRERIIQKFGKYAKISNVYIPSGFKDLDSFMFEDGTANDLIY